MYRILSESGYTNPESEKFGKVQTFSGPQNLKKSEPNEKYPNLQKDLGFFVFKSELPGSDLRKSVQDRFSGFESILIDKKIRIPDFSYFGFDEIREI